jgi:hypothetical protein
MGMGEWGTMDLSPPLPGTIDGLMKSKFNFLIIHHSFKCFTLVIGSHFSIPSKYGNFLNDLTLKSLSTS